MSWKDIFTNGSDIFLFLPSLDKQSKSEITWEDIFYNGSTCVSLEIESSQPVNAEPSMAIDILNSITAILILLLVSQALYKMYGSKLTFINCLVFLDIFNAAGHVPILLTFVYVY